MLKIQSTVYPPSQPSQMEWEKEFSVGVLAPKRNEGKERAKEMMNLWKDKNNNIDFTHTIKKLSHA